jgi:DNA-binding winged helix-turn-helix (wHTH) protein
MVVGLVRGVSFSYDEPRCILTVYRHGVRLQENVRLDTLAKQASRAVELLCQMHLPGSG